MLYLSAKGVSPDDITKTLEGVAQTGGMSFSTRTRREVVDILPSLRHDREYSIEVQKMNWKFRAGVREHTGVCLERHGGHNCTGGYTCEYPNTAAYLWHKTKKRATHNKYFKGFVAVVVSGDKALSYFAAHPEIVPGLFGLYCKESAFELKQAA